MLYMKGIKYRDISGQIGNISQKEQMKITVKHRKKGVTIMKQAAIILTLSAAVCALSSCTDFRYSGENDQGPIIVVETTEAARKDVKTTNTASSEEAGLSLLSETVTYADTEQADSSEATITTVFQEKGQYEDEENRYYLDPTIGTNYREGRTEENVYISDYAGIKITAPEGVNFRNREELYTEYMMPTRFMDEEARRLYNTAFSEASVEYGDMIGDVTVWFVNTKLGYPEAVDMTAEDYIKNYVMDFSPDIDITDICEPVNVTMGGAEYTKAAYTCFSVPRAIYARRIDDDFILKIVVAGDAVNDIEGRISSVG